MFQILFLVFLFYFNTCWCVEDDAWLSYKKEFQHENREELVVKSVKLEENIRIANNVSKWNSYTVGRICYSIGLIEKGLVALFSTLRQDRSTFNVTTVKLELHKNPSDVVLSKLRINEKSEVIVLVTYIDEAVIDWFLLSNRTLEKLWTWKEGGVIYNANIFEVSNHPHLTLIYKTKENVNLKTYRIEMEWKNFRLSLLDEKSLTEPATSSSVIYSQTNVYFAIPQTTLGEILIYKIVDNIFEKYTTVKSRNVKTISHFQIRNKAFIAIDGYRSGIYEFSENGITSQKLVQGNLEGIYYWLPIPVETYRDEAILLAERVLEHDSHKSYTLEIIVNNGGKFEEHEDIPCTHHGVLTEWHHCLSHDSRISGSTWISVDGRLGIIVPQKTENYSEIFTIEYELVLMQHPKEKELNMLLALKNNLQGIIESQIEELENLKQTPMGPKLTRARVSSEKQRAASHAELFDLRSGLDDIAEKVEELKEEMNNTKEALNTFDTIILDGTVEFTGKLTVEKIEAGRISNESTTELLGDIINKKNITAITGKKTFTNLEINNLSFDKLNGIEAENIVLSANLPLNISGNVTFEQPLEVNKIVLLDEKINEKILLGDIVPINKNFNNDTLEFENVKVLNNLNIMKFNQKDAIQNSEKSVETLELQSAFLPENVTVSFINGENLEELINDMCLVNVKCYIPRNISIVGNIIADETFTDFLNDLEFPNEYILLDSVSHAEITGQKHFKNSLSADEIMTEGTVGGVDSSMLITLTTDQDIQNLISFENLELTEVLNVTGNITGEDMGKFLPNPTLKEADLVKSEVIIKELEVDGEIFIENNFNKVDFKDTLQDIVYKTDTDVTITGKKHFTKGLDIDNLIINSSMINNVDLESLVTKHEDQHLFSVSVLKGDVTIKRLFVHGNFGGYNVTELDESFVKLTGEQFIASTLLFQDELKVENLEITNKLNDHKAEDYLYSNSDNEIDWDVDLEDVIAEEIIVEGNFTGDIVENNFTSVRDRILCYSKDQIIEVPFDVRFSEVDELHADYINGVKFTDFLDEDGFQQDVVDKLNSGEISVKNLTVLGSLQIDRVDGESLKTILNKNPFKYNETIDNLTVEGDVYFKEVSIKKLSNVNWDRLLELIVFKNETTLKLSGTKVFESFKVEKLIETDKINDILLDNIFIKNGKQTIKGPIVIKGDVEFENIFVKKNINNVTMDYFTNNLTVLNNTYIVNGDMVFERLQYIKDLVIQGNINNKNPNKTLSQIAYVDEDITLTMPVRFSKPVNILGNTTVGNLNGENLSNLLSQIVYIDQPSVIHSELVFIEPVFLDENLQIRGNLKTALLAGVDTKDWLEKAIYLDRGLLLGDFKFENITIHQQLTTSFLNKQNMSSVIILNQNETLDDLRFTKVTSMNNIPVGNLVNGYKLSKEVSNTVKVEGKQQINSNLIFRKSILIRENINVNTINTKDATKIVRTNRNQNITSPFNFKNKCYIFSDLEVDGFVNGVNITNWNQSLKSFSPDVQEVTNDWNVLKNVTFNDVVDGEGIIENFNVTQLVKEVEKQKEYKYQSEGDIIETYKGICTDIKELLQLSHNQLYKFNYFDNLQELTFLEKLRNVFFFEFFNNQYLFVNEDNCMSHMFVFNSTMFYPLKFGIQTGPVDELITVKRDQVKYLVTRGGSISCLTTGTNIWEFRDNDLELKFSIENLDLIQDSLVPGTFYGLHSEGVTEYKISDIMYKKFREWKIFEENLAFFPRGLSGTGLALRTGDKIIRLDRSDPFIEESDIDFNSDEVIRGSMTLIHTTAVPGRNGKDLVLTNVGSKNSKKTYMAVAHSEETTVEGHTNVIKIYDNPLKGGIFQAIKSYNPSSLVSVEFEQGETILAFLENNKTLQIYEYKGIEGFKHRTATTLPGTKLLSLTLPIKHYINKRKALAIMDDKKITIIQAVMMGNRLEKDFKCAL